jgi:ribonuclease HI
MKPAEHNRIQLVLVPGHMGIDGNERTNQLATQGFTHTLIKLEPVLGISAETPSEGIRAWTNRKHADYWQSIRE